MLPRMTMRVRVAATTLISVCFSFLFGGTLCSCTTYPDRAEAYAPRSGKPTATLVAAHLTIEFVDGKSVKGDQHRVVVESGTRRVSVASREDTGNSSSVKWRTFTNNFA